MHTATGPGIASIFAVIRESNYTEGEGYNQLGLLPIRFGSDGACGPLKTAK